MDLDLLQDFNFGFTTVIGGILFLACLLALVHAVSFKRDSRSAALWVLIILFTPVLGVVFYVLFGLNRIGRIKRKARRMRGDWRTHLNPSQSHPHFKDEGSVPAFWKKMIPIGARITGNPISTGNEFRTLYGPREAYPAMLAAIRAAKSRVWLETYIFDRDQIGIQFCDALEDAVQRGVEVRVLVDALGSYYSFPSIGRELARRKIPFALFLPVFSVRKFSLQFLNLRNHRKLLICDESQVFMGGMNIRAHDIFDLHFEVTGPVVTTFENVFAEDWLFAAGEKLARLSAAAPQRHSLGEDRGRARVLVDGPDGSDDRLLWLWIQAIYSAEKEIQIQTPYFVPDQVMISALAGAAIRGVKIQILLPADNNLPWVAWATQSMLWQLLQFGVEVRFSQKGFDHGKWFSVDGVYAVIGSSNWDQRSWRLNFELNLEIFDLPFVKHAAQEFEARWNASLEVTLKQMDARRIAIRFRDGFARLFAPLL